ncbi:molybdopterin dinucleotide binding domain-containing protein [Streptomyces sp. Ru73]|uniref:molybdopterin dinucleotide binding domain-containing protein n=1 Tax=Streptomyces sp. Ru73 TaxID=2080748 RepID=UPI0015E33D57|nr:molybdopterin dinucleotide binding domain-containing protein [Streptomyces sp. Ru73]
MTPRDAVARGIETGDVVRLFNDRGAVLAGAVLHDGLRPGVVRLPTGAWFDPVPHDPGGRPLCVHGNPNTLTAGLPSSASRRAAPAHTPWVRPRSTEEHHHP